MRVRLFAERLAESKAAAHRDKMTLAGAAKTARVGVERCAFGIFLEAEGDEKIQKAQLEGGGKTPPLSDRLMAWKLQKPPEGASHFMGKRQGHDCARGKVCTQNRSSLSGTPKITINKTIGTGPERRTDTRRSAFNPSL